MFALFLSLFLSILVVFFAFFPINRAWLNRKNHEKKSSFFDDDYESPTQNWNEIVYDDAEV